MEEIRIKNFRSIVDSGKIGLKPITIFLGKNSCGKSSILRLFPLLKQTLEKDKQEPILWYGDNVDFGDFDDIIPKFSTQKNTFELSFKLNINANNELYFFRYFHFSSIDYFKDKNILVNVEMLFSKKEIVSIKLIYLDQKVEITINNNSIKKIKVNNEDIKNLSNYDLINFQGILLPEIKLSNFENQIKKFSSLFDMEFESSLNIFKENVHKIKDYKKYFKKIVCVQTKEELLEKLTNCGSKTIAKYFKEKDADGMFLQKFNNYLQVVMAPSIISLINQKISSIFENVYYMKPIRANANRYYRIQGVSVKKVDSDGSNVPMILYSMPNEKQKEFSEWCLNKFGIDFKIRPYEGHISLMVKTDNDYEINIADTGYGYSQMLPIILQSWLLIDNLKKNTKVKKTETIFVIEQPELHLHPAFQSKIMDIFVSLVKAIKETKNNIKILIETHSEAMINRLGELVSYKTISCDDVNVILVSKNNNISKFEQTEFDTEGYIKEWPVGFLSVD